MAQMKYFVKYTTMDVPEVEVELHAADLRKGMMKGASDAAIHNFMGFCSAIRLNPFIGEIIAFPTMDKYYHSEFNSALNLAINLALEYSDYDYDTADPDDTVRWIPQITHTGWVKIATRDQNYQGYESGIIIREGSKMLTRNGTFLADGEELLGGWCKVYHKRYGPAYHDAGLKEVKGNNFLWQTVPTEMVMQVAFEKAFLSIFPDFSLPENKNSFMDGLSAFHEESTDA